MPAAIPLVGAAFSIAGGVAAAGGMAAIAAGGLSALTLTSGLMIAGGALTGIGALTGNKKLMTLGSVLGLAGGISSLASKAGEAAGAAATAEAASQAAAEAGATTTANVGGNVVQGAGADLAAGAAETASNAASQAGVEALAGSQSGGLIADAAAPGTLAGDAGPWAMNGPGEAGPLADAGTSMAAKGAAAAPSLAADPMSMVGPSQDVGSMAQAGSGGPMTGTRFDLQQGTYDGGYSGRGPDSIPGQANSASPGDWWSKAKQFGSDATDWMKKNPEATKLGGGLVQGAMQYYGNQQIADDNVKRQMAYQDWVRQRYSDSMRNLTVPSVVRTASASGGIIGGARG